MPLPNDWVDPNSEDVLALQQLTQTTWENVVGNLLFVGGTTGRLRSHSSNQVGTLEQLWLENLGAGGSRWVADVGNSVGAAQNELFIGRFHTGASDGWSGTALQPSLILSNDLTNIRTYFTSKTGAPIFGVSHSNESADPGWPWLRSDGSYLVINSRPTQLLYLNLDTGSMVSAQGQLRVDNANTNGGGIDLIFGTGSEGIGSKRTSGGNQNGLDFFIGGISRVAIDSAGNLNALSALQQRGYRMPLIDYGTVASQAWASGATTKSVTFQASMFASAPRVYVTPFGSAISGATFQYAANNTTTSGSDIIVQTSNTGLTFGLYWLAVGT